MSATTYSAPAELEKFSLHATWNSVARPSGGFDPFSFSDRMAVYRELIAATNRHGQFGADNRKNLLWGLMFQHQWQYDSGRLGDGAKESGRIEPDSAWGFGNYTLCVIPWLGAVSAGVVEDLDLVGPPGTSRFEYACGPAGRTKSLPESFADGVAAWSEYFTQASEFRGGDSEGLRMQLWAAHKVCLDIASERLRGIDPAPYSELELEFLQGWCRMVDYLWVAAWPTDFDFMAENGMDVLPDHPLQQGVRELTAKQRNNVRNIVALGKLSDRRYRINLALWKRTMRTRSARENVLSMLDAVFNPQWGNAKDIAKMLGYLIRP